MSKRWTFRCLAMRVPEGSKAKPVLYRRNGNRLEPKAEPKADLGGVKPPKGVAFSGREPRM